MQQPTLPPTTKTIFTLYCAYQIQDLPLYPLNIDIAWTDTAEATTWSNYLYVRYPALRKNKRTINFSRYTGNGDQRKQIGFSGDALRKFDTLQYEVYMTPRAGNVGFADHVKFIDTLHSSQKEMNHNLLPFNLSNFLVNLIVIFFCKNEIFHHHHHRMPMHTLHIALNHYIYCIQNCTTFTLF